MSKHLRSIVPVTLLGLALTSCEGGTGPVQPMESLPRSLSAAEQEIITSSNDFAFRLLRRVNQDQQAENVFISPLSVSMALGMTMNGAAGTSFDEMRSTLGFDGLTQAEINAAYSDLLDLLLDLDRSVEMEVGNSVWYRQEFPFEDNFFATVRNGFRAHVEGLDFADPASPGKINGWVRSATRNRIDEIIDVIPNDAVMYLINGIYFKGSWTDQFVASRTRTHTFTGLEGRTLDVRLMSNDGSYRFGWHTDYEIVELPYGAGAFAMTVLLPKEGRDINSVLADLDDEQWSEIVGGLANGRMIVELPRFRLEYDRKLNETLIALGMPSPFIGGVADFSGMSSTHGRDLAISEVKHKTFVEVNEKGTEAAAVTSVGVVLTSMPPTFRVDRPFLFVLRERFSGTILFMGKIVAPEEA